ncbi:BAG family molecular chaperone regulator 6-like [Benincasa hispida]|uniref:BAG family molecular chaperone regulator 6-like n=1 Tax=Benincasa hispida TaxID=102211 RepID=UPI0018FF72B8|nr:BAG family molecular chaperone regulator 6-like [Benincasa hispida]XP_038898976.1 BAG family molecular chaperone regulator 6-like [Benincasa hispida]
MESPFFRNRWNYHPQRPRYPPSMVEIPVRRPTVPVAPKVVSIPVRFVESKKSRSDSATKIQKVFRGFLVRKSVKKVVAIEREVSEIERRFANEETVDLIRKDGKEKIMFGEMLMNLLFRLDSVKGVDSGIRNLRKAVIKKAIVLQEKIDSIAATDEATDVINETLEAAAVKYDSEAVDRSSEGTPELKDKIPEHEDENSAADIANSEPADVCDDDKMETQSGNCRNEGEDVDGVALKTSSMEKDGAIHEESTACSMESSADPEISQNSPGKDEVPVEVENDMMHIEVEAAEEWGGMSEAESQTDSSNNPPNTDDGVAEFEAVDEREGSGKKEDAVKEEEEEEEDSRIKGREEGGQSRELLERMMMDNKRMMEMMTQLFEKNEMQSKLLCSLSHRVDRLEKAVVYEMLQKKKRRNSTDCSEKCPKTKKGGK